jgi:lipoyl(octanoyl) transferase
MVRWSFLGRTEYRACWALQQRLCEERRAGLIDDTLLLTEHDPVYTIGRAGNPLHLLAGAEELLRRKIALVETDRGGDITYHGPGQLVGYPILDLGGSLDLHRYLRDLEEVVIRTLAAYGVTAGRVPGYTGVWVGGEKVCAIGIRARGGVTMHGFALNVTTDLRAFDRIIPCGIFERGVTSMEEILGAQVPLEEVGGHLVAHFGEVFGCSMAEGDLAVSPDGALGAGSGRHGAGLKE